MDIGPRVRRSGSPDSSWAAAGEVVTDVPLVELQTTGFLDGVDSRVEPPVSQVFRSLAVEKRVRSYQR